ncbi:hypothetical protein, partial [Pararhodospirillum oryzae]|uniref:hypothetical protein n=1 Tax=Pararhodospirillum oryzae TaxID=478448 RepID=UPI0014780C47
PPFSLVLRAWRALGRLIRALIRRRTTTARAFGAYLVDVVRSALFGGQNLTRDLVRERLKEDLVLVRIESDLPVLAFDLDLTDAVMAYAEGREQAERQIRAQLTAPAETLPPLLAALDAALVARMAPEGGAGWPRRLIEAGVKRIAGDADVGPGSLRLAILEPHGSASLRVTFSHNMDDDADDQMILDPDNPGAPAAFRTRAPTFLDLENEPADLFMTKYERALVRPSLRSVLSLPLVPPAARDGAEPDAPIDVLSPDAPIGVLSPGAPIGVLSIDSDLALQRFFDDPEFMGWLADQARGLAQTLAHVRAGETPA